MFGEAAETVDGEKLFSQIVHVETEKRTEQRGRLLVLYLYLEDILSASSRAALCLPFL